jgi:signal recognition particle subunit SRP54
MLDGDARGGAALSIREVTGVPIRFAGTGEAMDRIEPFRPDGMASRILGMGDIVSVVNQFTEVVDQKSAEQQAKQMLEGDFDFDMFVEQINTIQKMGPLQDLFDRLPFFPGGMPQDVKVDDRELDRVKAIVGSMTRSERKDAELFRAEPRRVERVAKGAGTTKEAVAELIAKFVMMRDMMRNIGQQAGLLSKIPGAKQLAMARRLKDLVKVQGEQQAMANLAQELLESAVAGGGPGGLGNMNDPEAMMRALMGGGGPGAPGRPAPRMINKPKVRDARKKNKR